MKYDFWKRRAKEKSEPSVDEEFSLQPLKPDFLYKDVLLHCFSSRPVGLSTLCGLEYSEVVFAHRPGMFVEPPYDDVQLCKACRDHPDLALEILGDLP